MSEFFYYPDDEKPILLKLSKEQLYRGEKVLNEILKEISGNKDYQKLINLSNEYYTVIPHAFGKHHHAPKVIESEETLLMEVNLLNQELVKRDRPMPHQS